MEFKVNLKVEARRVEGVRDVPCQKCAFGYLDGGCKEHSVIAEKQTGVDCTLKESAYYVITKAELEES